MTRLANLTWLMLGGFLLGFFWMVAGLLCSLSVVGLRLGRRCFEIGRYIFWPFGSKLSIDGISGLPVAGHVAWLFLLGQLLALLAFVLGTIFCVTVIGFPFGLLYFKLAKTALFPMNARVTAAGSSAQQTP